jgi:uncharacterized protein
MIAKHCRSFERLDPANYRRTPWKSGGGVTIDIAGGYRLGAASSDWTTPYGD